MVAVSSLDWLRAYVTVRKTGSLSFVKTTCEQLCFGHLRKALEAEQVWGSAYDLLASKMKDALLEEHRLR
jgi:hypothetical protein